MRIQNVLPKSETNSGQAVKGIGRTRWVFLVCKQFSWTEVNDEYVTPDDCFKGFDNPQECVLHSAEQLRTEYTQGCQ